MTARMTLAVVLGLVLLTLCSLWFTVASPYAMGHLALSQMDGAPWSTTALHVCAKISAGLPAAMLCVYGLSCLVIFRGRRGD